MKYIQAVTDILKFVAEHYAIHPNRILNKNSCTYDHYGAVARDSAVFVCRELGIKNPYIAKCLNLKSVTSLCHAYKRAKSAPFNIELLTKLKKHGELLQQQQTH